MASTKVKLKPFLAPNFVSVEMPPRLRQEGMAELPSIPITMIEADALEDLVFEWVEAVYKKAGSRNPFYRPAKPCAQGDPA